MSSGIFRGPVCCICWTALTIQNCVADALGDYWDCCPGACAKLAGIETGPVNIYIYGQLLWEVDHYQEYLKKCAEKFLKRIQQESSWEGTGQNFDPSVGLFQQREGKWE